MTTDARPAVEILRTVDRRRGGEIGAKSFLRKDLGITGTPGFIVGTELVPGALDLNGLKDLIIRAGNHARLGSNLKL
jgi:hypothetical protein